MFTRKYFSLHCQAILGCVVFLGGAVVIRAGVPLPEELYPQLKPVLEKALTQSTQMLQRNIDLAQAEATRISTNSLLLPNVGAGFSYSSNSSAISSGASSSSKADGVFYSISISQPLYQWGTLKAQTDSAKIGVLIAEKNYAEAYRLLALQIRSQFLSLIIKKMTLRNADDAMNMAKSALALQEEKLRVGGISQSQLAPAQLGLEETELARDRAVEDLSQALRFFAKLAGLDDYTAEQIPEDIKLLGEYSPGSYATPMLAKFLSGEIDQTFQAQVYHYYITQADLAYKVSKYRLFPKFSVSAGYSLSNSTSVSGNAVQQAGVTSQSVSISGYWSIFDGFSTKASKLSALTTKRGYELQYNNYISGLEQQVKGLEKQLNFSAKAMKLADARYGMQAGAVELTAHEVRRGVGSENDLIAAKYGLAQVGLSAAFARADFLSKWAEFISTLNLDPAMQFLPAKYLRHAK